jgi:hypothetical protein
LLIAETRASVAGYVSPAPTQWVKVKVRISKTPAEVELDGVRLDSMRPGVVREVSPSIGAWLVAERYAMPEMRRDAKAYEEDFLREPDSTVSDRPRRRRSDWR